MTFLSYPLQFLARPGMPRLKLALFTGKWEPTTIQIIQAISDMHFTSQQKALATWAGIYQQQIGIRATALPSKRQRRVSQKLLVAYLPNLLHCGHRSYYLGTVSFVLYIRQIQLRRSINQPFWAIGPADSDELSKAKGGWFGCSGNSCPIGYIYHGKISGVPRNFGRFQMQSRWEEVWLN